MPVGDYFIAGIQDTIKDHAKINLPKTGVQISLDLNRIPSSEKMKTLNESDILIPRQEIVPPKKTYFRKKSLENQNLLNDSTNHLKPRPDLYQLQVTVQPKGLILPSFPHQSKSTDWFTVLLIVSLVLFAFVRHTSKKYFSLLFQSIRSSIASARLYREHNISLLQVSSVMEFFYLLVMALFAFQVFQFYGLSLPFSDFVTFLILFAAIFLFIEIKLLFYQSLGFISETLTDTREHLFNIKNHNKSLGILLFPLVAIIAWFPIHIQEVMIISGMVLIALFYISYLFRGMKILIKKQYSIFYLFLYLCTLEFLPFLLLMKIIQAR
jgi:hypothetical protein